MMDDMERCDMARHSDFPCAGLMRDEWEGMREYRICEEHRQRILEDIRREDELKREMGVAEPIDYTHEEEMARGR